MLQGFSRWMLYSVMGWKKNITVELPEKCIICLAPHTSNWDFLIGQLYAHAEGMKTRFLMKKEWFFWPLGPLFRKMGGVPVFRDKKTSMTDNLAETARSMNHFQLTITPEGTRKANGEWKRGFYYIAEKAGIPILLYGVDYQQKLIQCTKSVTPSGDIEKELPEIKQYFAGFKGRHPEKFAI